MIYMMNPGMNNKELPKKILRITDLTFILPDDFNGNVQNALMMLAAYLNIELKTFHMGGIPVKTTPTIQNGVPKVRMEYGIFELDENGKYQLK